MQPWPLAIVIDSVLQHHPLGAPLVALRPFAHWVATMAGHDRLRLLVLVVIGGVLLQIANQVASMFHTQVQVDTGQRMVYDLRYRLFQHLQALGLHHHVATSTGDAVYRIDVDAYAVENLLIGGFPVLTSVATLVVMFTILLKKDVPVALLSLAVVPFMYLSIRYYMSTLLTREERVKEIESKLVQRLFETFSAMRLVKSFARENHEAARYAKAGYETMMARIALTWQQSVFSALVTTITILGTALVVIVGGLHVMRGRMSVGDLWIVI